MNKKARDLMIIAAIYLIAYAAGLAVCIRIHNEMLRLFVFDAAATVVTFAFSAALTNSSVYDAYWSLTPMVMSLWLFIANRAFSLWQLLFLIVFNVWSLRLTLNWVTVFTGFSYEDWRYRQYRENTPKLFWPIVNFWGIHMMPTLIVFAGMLPMFEIVRGKTGPLSIPGMLILLLGAAFEFFADRQMHAFLKDGQGRSVCRNGLWRYSRHPNYLGEITVWLGVLCAMLPYAPERWYYCIGFVSVAVLFNAVSVPLMEKRQLSRRGEYAQYRRETSRLLLRPPKRA